MKIKWIQHFLFLPIMLLIGTGYSQFRTNRTIHGTGASYPYPVYAQWTFKYYHLNQTRINYQSIGSGGGIAQIKAKTIDFGASDAPLSYEVLETSGLLQFPLIMGAVVPIINLSGIEVGELKLTGEILSEIYLGRIKFWNDHEIQSLNPDLKLPGKPITVIYRSDGSGSTWIFTNYLDEISSEWQKKVGKGEAVRWPTGVGARGNEGVSFTVQNIAGSIGYVQYAYAFQNNLSFVQLKNKSGEFVSPSMKSFIAAAEKAVWNDSTSFFMKLINQEGKTVWPIFGVSYILMHKEQEDITKARTLLQFFDWCYRFGKRDAEKLYYVPIPERTVDLIQSYWQREIVADGTSVWDFTANSGE